MENEARYSQEKLFGKAKAYQKYMKSIAIPSDRCSVIPYMSWVGLGRSIEALYNQPLHYLTHLELRRMDRLRFGAEDEDVPLDMIIHPDKAENTIWLMEDIHRRTTSPHHLLQLWKADPYHEAVIYPKFP